MGAVALKAAALLVTPSALFAAGLVLTGGPDGAATADDPRCISADRAAARRIDAIVDRPGRQSTRALERGVSVLVAARAHCAYGWVDQGLADYAMLEQELAR